MTTQTQRLAAALAGLLSAAAGLGAAMPVAAALGADDPARALGGLVIDNTPGALKDWAIRTLGTADKPVLLGSIFAVMALLAALTGLLAARRRRAGLGLALLLNLIALAAAVGLPGGPVRLTAGTILPGVVAIVVSLALLAAYTSRRVGLREEPAGFDRRAFLALALASGAVAGAGSAGSSLVPAAGSRSRSAVKLPAAADAASPIPSGTELPVRGITRYMTPNKDFYRVDTALRVPQIDVRSWRLRVHGMVERERTFTFEDLLDLPLVERRITLTCVSNEVGGDYAGNATWLGVRTRDLLEMVGVRDGADAVKSTSDDNMIIGTPLQALTDDRDALIAVAMNGVPLPLDHGFPARMVTPGLYGYVSATKWLTDLEVTRFEDFSAYWTDRGWAEEAPIHTASRIDVPRQFQPDLKPGKIAVAGVAWAQHTGIDRVEVRVDGGEWQSARLAEEDGIDTWRQWVLEWDATSGRHLLEVRATDRSGYTQTPHRTPPRPDGATGWHTVTVNVA